MKESQHMPILLWKMVFLLHICSVCFAEARKKKRSKAVRSKAVHLLAREECNKYDLTAIPYF
jgi:hypothetical protein